MRISDWSSDVCSSDLCRQEEQQRVNLFRFLTQDKESRDSGRRPRATPLRLKDDARGADRRALEERRNQEAVLFIADDQRGCKALPLDASDRTSTRLNSSH